MHFLKYKIDFSFKKQRNIWGYGETLNGSKWGQIFEDLKA